MSEIVLKAENISKQYRLGTVGSGTLRDDLTKWWHEVRGKENPLMKVGDVNDRSIKGDSEYVWALQDINFEVKQGEVLGIIGKNGAGKSTLLKILSKVTAPTTGNIKVKGRIASLLEVGTGFHPELTGRENIYLNGAILGMKKKEMDKKMDEIVEFAGIARYSDTPTKRYSSGMTVRLGFAVAAYLEPEILVVDEVLAVGDKEFQRKAIGKMQDISNHHGRTILFVSHNMDSVRNLCNRGLVLESGVNIFEGTQLESVDFYLNNQSQKATNKLFFTEKGNYFGEIHSISVNEKQEDILVGDDLEVRVCFSLLQESNQRIDISLAITNDDDIDIMKLSTGLMANSPVKNIIGEKQTLTFRTKNINLNIGLYAITFRIVENRANHARLRVDNVILFEVKSEQDGIYHQSKSILLPDFNVIS